MPVSPLKPNPVTRSDRKRPVVLCICDGMGYGTCKEADAVASAHTPTLDMMHSVHPHVPIAAHGTWVGLPSDGDMGNSEVGHNTIGCGKAVDQGAKLVNRSIDSGAMFAPDSVFTMAVSNCVKNGSALHFLGLLSDGGVHSSIDHLFSLLRHAHASGVKEARVHVLFDGRDVGEDSGMTYLRMLADVLRELSTDGCRYLVASGGGRMRTTMDRYNSDWTIVERGYLAHTYGYSVHGNYHDTVEAAYEALRAKGDLDQNLQEFVLVNAKNEPLGPIRDRDSVILYNFRGDRAIEISRAMDAVMTGTAFAPFPLAFSRADVQQRHGVPAATRPLALPDSLTPPSGIVYAGMMLYDGDLNIPRHFLVAPPTIANTLDEYLCATGLSSFAVSETQKYGHVTYFFNGNRSGKFSERLDTYVEVPSDKNIDFSDVPWMRAHEITNATIEAIESGKYDFVRLNYANPDMVGHCGIFDRARLAVECVDVCLARLYAAVKKAGGAMVVIADHGNSDEMYEVSKGKIKVDKAGNKIVKTSHTLNPVPCIVCEFGAPKFKPTLKAGKGLSSVAATVIELLGYTKPDGYDESVLEL